MANAYRTKRDITFPRVIATIKRENGDDFHETQGVNYSAGSVILAENMTPRDRERADSGDLDWALDPVDDREDVYQTETNPNVGVFIPEHEAEAHALKQAGHLVVPPDQALRALASGASYKAQYQQAAKEAGLDYRPVQEHHAQHRHDIPDEILIGSETRSGRPHDTSPEGFNEEDSEGDSEETPAPRPRPGSES